MKQLLIAVVIMGTTTAYSSDQMTDEIICTKIVNPGEADNGLVVKLKSNKTAWVKELEIIEYGYLGERIIAQVQVPLLPTADNLGHDEKIYFKYEGNGSKLILESYLTRSASIPSLTGYGEVELSLADYTEEIFVLQCEVVKKV